MKKGNNQARRKTKKGIEKKHASSILDLDPVLCVECETDDSAEAGRQFSEKLARRAKQDDTKH